MSESAFIINCLAVACVFVGGTVILLGTLAAWLTVMDWLWRHVLDQLGWRREFVAFMWERARQRKEKESP